MSIVNDLKGQVALITGGGRGLGREYALELSRAGARVAVLARTHEQLDSTVEAIRLEGHSALAIPADVTDRKAVQAAVGRVTETLGPIDLLVSNAGKCPPFGETWTKDADDWWQTIETNIRGSINCFNAVIPTMIERRRGRVILVASSRALQGSPYMSAYAISKTALIRLAEVLANEVQKYGIFVFAMHPGTLRTAMTEEILHSEDGKLWLPDFKDNFAEGKEDSLSDASRLIKFLASGEADDLSGRFFLAPRGTAKIVGHKETILDMNLNLLRVRFLEDAPYLSADLGGSL
jgi:NAD(P)-dependent dehydrogenase (short-subunit alcohol dehydrogenase family)